MHSKIKKSVRVLSRMIIACFYLVYISQVYGSSNSKSVDNRKPNVVILYTDDQGTVDTNAYGSKDLYTPNMDRLANEGVRFTQAYAHTVCCPSRAMLLTGQHPQRVGINNWTQTNPEKGKNVNMPLEVVTIAEILKNSGYKTALFGKWHLGAKAGYGPLEQGFDVFYGALGGYIDNYNHYCLSGDGWYDLYDQDLKAYEKGKYFPDLMTARAVDFMHQNRDQPFLMYMAYNIPHYPEQADEKFEAYYRDTPMPRKQYGKMISTTDDRMGIILDELDRLGLAENTIVIFMSDNGHSHGPYTGGRNSIRSDHHSSGLIKGHYFGPSGGGSSGKWKGAKTQLYEGGIRVPAIVRYPRLFEGGLVRDQIITACDWMPTILDICKISLSGEHIMDGQSLLPIINDNATTHHNVLYYQWGSRWMVRKGEWKLIHDGKNGKSKLLNLSDPEPESIDYLSIKPEIVEEFKGLHNSWKKSLED